MSRIGSNDRLCYRKGGAALRQSACGCAELRTSYWRVKGHKRLKSRRREVLLRSLPVFSLVVPRERIALLREPLKRIVLGDDRKGLIVGTNIQESQKKADVVLKAPCPATA